MATRDNLIEVKDLKKHYHGNAIKALDGVSTEIHSGDVCVVIGPSGSGKSTFLRSLNLLEEPTGGSIIFEGIDITKKKYKDENGKTVRLDIDKLRQKMGMVFQHFNLFPHMTILDNMTLAPMKVKGMSKEEAEKKALELLGVERYDLVLLDPPYGKGILQRVLPAFVPRLSDDAMVVCESGRDEELPAQVGSFVLDRERRHGKTKIALYLRGKDLAE